MPGPRRRSLSLLLALVGVASCRSGPEVAGGAAGGVDQGTATSVAVTERPELDWWRQSMDSREQRIGWFRDARFGMFVHWGVYSGLGGVWEGTPVKGYAEHIQRIMKIPGPVYQEKVAGQFNPRDFNADEWIGAAKHAGMRYFIITSKHHDGFAMFDSNVSDYNVVKATPWHHDPMRDLREAARRQGVHFGFYYSAAWDWQAAGGPGEAWGYPRAQERSFETDAEWLKTHPAEEARIKRYVDGKAIPQVRELIAKYDPDIIWFDTPSFLPLTENLRILRAAREAKPTLVVNGRVTQGAPGGPKARFGDYLSTTDKPAEFPPNDGDWEAIPTTNESYGWHKMDSSHKPPEHFIQLLAKAAARGGNVLLNIGPMGNGKMDPKDLKILDGVGAWMKVNEASIRGTDRTPLAVQAWGESTRKGSTLYLHVLNWPSKGRIVVGGLKSKVKGATLLADPRHAPLKVERAGDLDVVVQGPAQAPDQTDTVIALDVDGEVVTDRPRLIGNDVAVDILRAFDAHLANGLSFGAGKLRDSYVLGWDRPDEDVSWLVRLREPATYEVAIAYDSDPKSVGGTYVVRVGGQQLTGTVGPTPTEPVVLGKVTVEPGKFEIVVTPTKIVGGELMRLRGITLTPVAAKS
jgi:alpha-L-fucosidase